MDAVLVSGVPMTVQPARSLTPLLLPGVRTASELVETASDPFTGKMLPVRDDLAQLLPARGLTRGSTVAVAGSVALLLALLSEASTAGSWIAIVGMPELGVLATEEHRLVLERLALVPRPDTQFVNVVGALLDGVDIVVLTWTGVSLDPQQSPGLARRLSSRARHRGAVLMPFGSWPVTADLDVAVDNVQWTGLAHGHGNLVEQTGNVRVRGRAGAARPTRRRLELRGRRLDRRASSTWINR